MGANTFNLNRENSQVTKLLVIILSQNSEPLSSLAGYVEGNADTVPWLYLPQFQLIGFLKEKQFKSGQGSFQTCMMIQLGKRNTTEKTDMAFKILSGQFQVQAIPPAQTQSNRHCQTSASFLQKAAT